MKKAHCYASSALLVSLKERVRLQGPCLFNLIPEDRPDASDAFRRQTGGPCRRSLLQRQNRDRIW